jgi:putative methionine-R-sulfoxide reductase with GAF domain/HAMP domain-containing protein
MAQSYTNAPLQNLKIGTKLGLGFGAIVVLFILFGAFTIFSASVQNQSLAQLETFNGAVLAAERMEVSFLNARRLVQTFLARWSVDGYDASVANYIVPNQATLAELRAQGATLLAALEGEGDAEEDIEDVEVVLRQVDEYEILLNSLVADIGVRGFESTGLEGSMRIAAAALENAVVVRENPNLYVSLLQMRRYEKDFLLRHQPEDVGTAIIYAENLKAQIGALGLSIEETTDLNALIDDYERYLNELVIVQLRIDSTDNALFVLAENIRPVLDEIIVDETAEAAEAREAFEAVQRQILALTPLTLGVTVIAGVVLAYLIGRNIVNSIQELTQTAENIAAGDFSQRVDVRSNDEVGQLGQSFNQMVETIVLRNRDVQAIVDVAGRIGSILDETRLLQDVVDLSKERFNLYHAHIYLLDEAGHTLVLTAGSGYVGRQMVAENRIIALNNPDSIVARTARERQSVIVNDVRASETFLPHPLLPQTRSELAVALVARGQLLGVLDVQSSRADYFDANILTVMETLAAQIASGLSNARLYDVAQRNSRHAQAISVIQQNMQSATDMDEMLRTTARELAKALRVPYTAIELKLNSANGDETIPEYEREDVN